MKPKTTYMRVWARTNETMRLLTLANGKKEGWHYQLLDDYVQAAWDNLPAEKKEAVLLLAGKKEEEET